jgi:hypothetical protein
MNRLLCLTVFAFPTLAFAVNQHPRIWLNSTMLSELRAKACIGQSSGCTIDPDYTAIKADADILKTYIPQKLTVVSMSNSNPMVVTTNEAISSSGWRGGTGGQAGMFVGGLGGPACTAANSWTCVNTPNSRVAMLATQTGPKTFTLPFDSTSWGAYPGNAVLFIINGTPPANTIYYDYEGLGWLAALQELGLMYQITGDAAYATPALALLDYINSLAPTNLVAPFIMDSGFPARGSVLAVALSYDWFYPLLSSVQKSATIATLNTWYAFYQANINNPNVIFTGHGDAVSNYWGGFMLGFGAAGYATLGDNSTADAMVTFIRSEVDTYLGQAVAPPQTGSYPDTSDLCPASGGTSLCGGSLNGGYAAEGFNYGPNHFMRMLQYLFMIKTATGEDVFSTTAYAAPFAKAIATNFTYSLFPNMWQAPNVGESGEVLPLYRNLPWLISYLRQGQPESGWMQYMVQHMAAPPSGLPAAVGYQGATTSSLPMDRFLWYRSSIPATDYTSTTQPYYFSNGDGGIHWRSDWTTSATKLTFAGAPTYPAGHHIRNAAGITLVRGSDYLIINAGHYAGTNGYAGSSPETTVSDAVSTLHFDDGGAYMFGYNTQQNWGTWLTPRYKLTVTYAYAHNDFTSAYDDKPGYHPASARTLKYFFRSVAQVGNSTLVYDQVMGSQASYSKKLYWYISPITAALPILANNTASAVVGNSKVFVSPILPLSPTLTLAQIPGGSPYRVEISDSAGLASANFVTLLFSTSSTGSQPATTSLTSSSNAVAVQVADTTPVVFVHASVVTDNGNNSYTATPQTSMSFTSTHSGTGNYLVGGLVPGTYAVKANGSALGGYNSVVGSDGVLSFSATSGSFSIQQTGSIVPPTCDLNGDGIVNGADVDLALKQSLGTIPCTNGDLDGNGSCNVVDVQRVVNAANGQACRIGQ